MVDFVDIGLQFVTFILGEGFKGDTKMPKSNPIHSNNALASANCRFCTGDRESVPSLCQNKIYLVYRFKRFINAQKCKTEHFGSKPIRIKVLKYQMHVTC